MLVIPPNLDFADLSLELRADGGWVYRSEPLAAFARANAIDTDLSDEDVACELICVWYVAHREAGGQADATAETIIALLNASGMAGND